MLQRVTTRRGPVRPSCTCTKGLRPLDSNSGNCLNDKANLVPVEVGRNAEDWLGAVVLLARRRSRQPGCFASGESQGIIRREKFTFPLRMFPGFLGPEAFKLSVTPARQAELVCFPQQCNIASCGSRAVTALAQVWGRAAPSVPFC